MMLKTRRSNSSGARESQRGADRPVWFGGCKRRQVVYCDWQRFVLAVQSSLDVMSYRGPVLLSDVMCVDALSERKMTRKV